MLESDIILRLAELLDFPTPESYNQQNVYQILLKSLEFIEKEKSATRNSNKKSNFEVVQKARNLESELKLSITSVESADSLKSKQEKLTSILRKERDKVTVLEEFVLTQNQKINLLVEHVEKLVQFLRVESHLKSQAIAKSKDMLKELNALQEKYDFQSKKVNAQNRAIQQLNEGSKILEDQLKLMDEKFLDLRAKLDTSRSIYTKETRKIRKDFSDLRLKYALAHHGQLLDSVRIPEHFNGSSPIGNLAMSQTAPQLQGSGKLRPKSPNTRPMSAFPSSRGEKDKKGSSLLRPLSASTGRLGLGNQTTPSGKQKRNQDRGKFDDLSALQDDLLREEPESEVLVSIVEKIHKKDHVKKVWTDDQLKKLIKKGEI